MSRILLILKRLIISEWEGAWIREEDGEIHFAKYRMIRNVAIIKLPNCGKMIQGNADGTTSRKQIAAWWPDKLTMDHYMWTNPPQPNPQNIHAP